MHDWDKGRRYCNACGCDIEDGHPCPGNGQDQILVLVRQLGKERVMMMVGDADGTIREEQRKQREVERSHEIERLRTKIADGEAAAARLAELERLAALDTVK